MAKVAAEVLDRSGLTLDDVDAFVPHQANKRITDAMARSMHLPERVAVAQDIVDQGNTSAASVPLALHRLVSEGAVRPGQRALLLAFGRRAGVRRPGRHGPTDPSASHTATTTSPYLLRTRRKNHPPRKVHHHDHHH